jgi:imidazoleglycerol-phosphate dehydratase
MARRGEVNRRTKETDIAVALELDGSGEYDVSTGIGMFDHMLEALAKHARFDLTLKATGDVDRDPHHLVEDVGICLGQAMDQALGERRGITRFGHAIVPMDDALVLAVVDLGGRGYARVNLAFRADRIGELPADNVDHFFESFAMQGRLNLHIRQISGENDHHRIEAAFKALARAIATAVALDSRIAGQLPSTKDAI